MKIIMDPLAPQAHLAVAARLKDRQIPFTWDPQAKAIHAIVPEGTDVTEFMQPGVKDVLND